MSANANYLEKSPFSICKRSEVYEKDLVAIGCTLILDVDA
jgi:hypothetical protein